jgi:outer membrane scaffolding protein for murein synthesis (MipA/OmpV family)
MRLLSTSWFTAFCRVAIGSVLLSAALTPFTEVHGQNVEELEALLPADGRIEAGTLHAVGAAVGVYPEYLGSKHQTTGAAPAFYFNLGNSRRYIQLIGPELSMNLLDSERWAAGPTMQVRFGRDADVSEPRVAHLRNIGNTVEVGGYLGWRKVDPAEIRNRLYARVQYQVDAGNVHNSSLLSVSGQWMQRVSLPLDVFVSAATSYAGKGYMKTYFGIDPSNVGASGLPFYAPPGGFRDVRMSAGLLFHFSYTWHVAVGGQYQKLLHTAADSPIVRIAGKRGQLMYGAALLYAWQ